jgi:ABC-type nitrate/sulfonate/bicarbonate transport system substrate-binding protein
MNKEYIKKNPEAPVQFLKAFNGAYSYYKNNVEQADKWFIEESKLKLNSKPLEIASSVEPNLKAKSDEEIRIGFIDDDYKVMQEASDFLLEQGLIKEKVVMKDFVDLQYLKKAQLK